MKRLLILGGGTGGTMVANHLVGIVRRDGKPESDLLAGGELIESCFVGDVERAGRRRAGTLLQDLAAGQHDQECGIRDDALHRISLFRMYDWILLLGMDPCQICGKSAIA